VWVPRFDIDWVLRWRLERRCLPWLFDRPALIDLIPNLGRLIPKPKFPPEPLPGPDPVPDFADRTARSADPRWRPA